MMMTGRIDSDDADNIQKKNIKKDTNKERRMMIFIITVQISFTTTDDCITLNVIT